MVWKSKRENRCLFPERKLKWTTNKVKALGTYFSTKAEAAWNQNFQEKIEKIRNLQRVGVFEDYHY